MVTKVDRSFYTPDRSAWEDEAIFMFGRALKFGCEYRVAVVRTGRLVTSYRTSWVASFRAKRCRRCVLSGLRSGMGPWTCPGDEAGDPASHRRPHAVRPIEASSGDHARTQRRRTIAACSRLVFEAFWAATVGPSGG